jgi:hypothetical protein
MVRRHEHRKIGVGQLAVLTLVAWASPLCVAPARASIGHSTRSRAALWLLALVVLGYGLAQRRRRS